jgi:ATP-binding cassette, subfamily B, bacterial
MKSFPHYRQLDAMDCGPTCLRMVAKYYGRAYSAQQLRTLAQIGKDGVNLLGIAEAAEAVGFRTLAVKISLYQLLNEAPLPAIVHWKQNHFVVVAPSKSSSAAFFQLPFEWLSKIWGGKKNINTNDGFTTPATKKESIGLPPSNRGQAQLLIADPAREGLVTLTETEFLAGWGATNTNGSSEGIVLLLENLPQQTTSSPSHQKGTIDVSKVLSYAWQYKRLFVQLGIGLLVASLLQLIFPFLTQSVVDIGINTRNTSFIVLALVGQLVLMMSRMSVEFVRSWLLMHISSRLNLSLLSDFLIKLTRLPLSFFDVKLFGDIMQRVGDHSRIEQFLTGQSLNTLFSLFNLVIFGLVLAMYSLTIFGVLLLAAALYSAWVILFLKFRRKLNHDRFEVSSKSNSALIQLIQGMQEIKLANAETPMRWHWERLQARSYKLGMKGLSVSQWQQAGAMIINESKTIFITYLSAQAVISGQLTLGGMLAVQYIIGQINGPIEQLIGLLQSAQDAKISLERLNEVYELDDESSPTSPPTPEGGYIEAPFGGWGATFAASLQLKNLTFTYTGAGNEPVLKDLSLFIPQGKTTAIVGMSGSGKTTLLKLLLRFYEPQKGEIQLLYPRPILEGYGPPVYGQSKRVALHTIPHSPWRGRCGVVMQDGFIFSDTIAHNIAVGIENIDAQKLQKSINVANIQAFIDGLPLGYHTKIGAEGMGISQGQRQRILIARAVYKDPDYIFFDEATNALDANNEAIIVHNLTEFFKGRTVVVVAHRLSTVKNADQIVVMEQGRIAETGTHSDLVAMRGAYYELVKNQLELGD